MQEKDFIFPKISWGSYARRCGVHSRPRTESCSDGSPRRVNSLLLLVFVSQWSVGADCRAVWSEDGQVYSATVISVDCDRCRVRFTGCGNEEDMQLSALQSPDEAPAANDWKAGSRCRAVYSEDGLVYPAVVLWVKGQRCRIRFDYYNNEEELDVSSLLTFDELLGPSRHLNQCFSPLASRPNVGLPEISSN
uniref:Tudor domain-containing protein n=1 Tax=Sphaeramia orbicularis TaxID=375764 RepID=A0A672ZUK6_9TELE